MILLYIIEIENFRHWKRRRTIMQEEQKTKAKELIDIHLTAVKNKYKLKIKTLVKGDRVDTILKVLKNKRYKIKNLILGLAMEGNDIIK